MNSKTSNIIILTLIIAFGANIAYAQVAPQWSRPTGTPSSSNNVFSPIHTGGNQDKTGGLSLGGGLVSTGSIFSGRTIFSNGGGAYNKGALCGQDGTSCLNFNNNNWIYIGGTDGSVYGGRGIAMGNLWVDSAGTSYLNGRVCIGDSSNPVNCRTSWPTTSAIPNLQAVTNVGNTTSQSITAETYYTSNWFRSYGGSGWYSQSYGGGWHMTDTTWIRAYGNKAVYTAGVIRGDGGFCIGGSCITNWSQAGSVASTPSLQAVTNVGSSTSNSITAGELYTNSWLRNNNAGTGLYNQATGQHFYSPSSTYWHLNSSNGLVLYDQYNGSAGAGTGRRGYLYYDGAGFGLLGNAGSWAVRIPPNTADVEIGNNLSFRSANPYISASSYFIAPGGAYFNSGTVYTEAAIHARGGIRNDTAGYLSILGGTSGVTYISGNTGIGTASPGAKLHVVGDVFIPSGNSYWIGDTGSGARLRMHAVASGGYIDFSPSLYIRENGGANTIAITSGSISFSKRTIISASVRGSGSLEVWNSDGSIIGNSAVRAVGQSVGVSGSGGVYDFYAVGIGTNYGAASSKRWKNNIEPIDSALGKVLSIRGVYFDWDEEHGGKRDMGFIAEEIGAIVPEVVQYADPTDASNWYTNEHGERVLYADGVDYGALTPVLVEAIKEQQVLIQELQSELCMTNSNRPWSCE